MRTRRATVVQRIGVIAAAALVAGSFLTGSAFAQDDGDTGPLPNIPALVDIPEVPVDIPDVPVDIPDVPDIPEIPDIPIPTLPSGTTSPSAPSGLNTQIIYSPYPFPVYGDFGHRSYGKYRDSGCGCDRYAAPTYNAPNYVAATQVSSVPKGGVDTGDGSFQ